MIVVLANSKTIYCIYRMSEVIHGDPISLLEKLFEIELQEIRL